MRINGRDVILDETLVTRVSIAVMLIDGYTNERPIGRVHVLLKELSRSGMLNPSGYFLFLNIPADVYTLRVESEHYRDEEFVWPTSPPEENPLVRILLPRPSYPFPPGATLIRGLVRDTSNNPVATARIEILGKNIESIENGEFVFYFRTLKEQDIITVNKKRFVKGNGEQRITVQAQHPTYGEATATTEAQEGKTAFVRLVCKL